MLHESFLIAHCFQLYSGLWSLDSLYEYFIKTNYLDVVEFMPLPCKSGVQILWHNPKGFQVKSGEYVKIKLPWLSVGGKEWHAFSIYMHVSESNVYIYSDGY